jgi:serine/threonine protein kinase
LRHPNVVPIRSAGEILGHAYFVMPWIEGAPLDEYVQSRRLSLADRVELLIKIGGAVEHAHQRGVMHLDLKPSNVRVDLSGEPVVMDFGLARLAGGDTSDASIPGAGIAGTPAYMAPEQVRNRDDVDIRADVFMLGLLLYEVMAGQRARRSPEGGESRRTLDIALQPVRPIREAAPRVDAEMAAIVSTATALAPVDRYATAKAFSDDLQRYISGAPVQVMGRGLWYRFRKLSRKHLVAVLGAIAIIVILVMSASIFLEAKRFAEEASGKAGRVTEDLIRTTERLYEGRLAKVFDELARLNREMGNDESAEEYEEQAKLSRRRAQARPEPSLGEGASDFGSLP